MTKEVQRKLLPVHATLSKRDYIPKGEGIVLSVTEGSLMSDVSQGPGWWLASDGKWYPPESAPNYQPTPTPTTMPSDAMAPTGVPGMIPPMPAMTQVVYKAVKTDPMGRELAHFGHRLGATLLDELVAFVIALPGIILLIATSSSHLVLLDNGMYQSQPSFKPIGVFGILVFGLLAVLYVPVILSMKGATFGNMALGTLVVDAGSGAQLRPGQAWGRTGTSWLISLVSSFALGIGSLLDSLWCLWDPNRQTLHDKAAKTFVVKKSAQPFQ